MTIDLKTGTIAEPHALPASIPRQTEGNRPSIRTEIEVTLKEWLSKREQLDRERAITKLREVIALIEKL